MIRALVAVLCAVEHHDSAVLLGTVLLVEIVCIALAAPWKRK